MSQERSVRDVSGLYNFASDTILGIRTQDPSSDAEPGAPREPMVLVEGSVDFDAPEIQASDAQDARLAFEAAKELGGVGHPVLVA
jgi:hypothetical protein